MPDFDEAKAKWARLQELISHTPDCDTDPWGPSDDHNHNLTHLREALIGYDDAEFVIEADEFTPLANGPEVLELVRYLFDLADSRSWSPYRDELSTLALEMSLCPLHLVDYAICFDDDDPDCSQIRAMFPSHDT